MRRTDFLNIVDEKVVCIDVHSHCGGIDMWNYQFRRLHMTQSMRDLALKMSIAGIDYFVVYPLASTTYFDCRTFEPSGIDGFPYELGNKALLYESQLFGPNALVFPAIHPKVRVREQVHFLEEELSRDSILGLKFHPLAAHATLDDLMRSDILQLMREYRLPMTIHSSDFDEYSDPKRVFALLEHCPDIRVSIAHCGFFDREFYRHARDFGNLYMDSSSFRVLCGLFSRRKEGNHVKLKWEEPQEALRELFQMFPDQLMWGTDEPWTCYTDYEGNLAVAGDIMAEKIVLESQDRTVREKISYYNTVRFLTGSERNDR